VNSCKRCEDVEPNLEDERGQTLKFLMSARENSEVLSVSGDKMGKRKVDENHLKWVYEATIRLPL
jgi:hypothetical protein